MTSCCVQCWARIFQATLVKSQQNLVSEFEEKARPRTDGRCRGSIEAPDLRSCGRSRRILGHDVLQPSSEVESLRHRC